MPITSRAKGAASSSARKQINRARKSGDSAKSREIGQDKYGKMIRIGNVIADESDETGVVTVIRGDALIYCVLGGPNGTEVGTYSCSMTYNCRVQADDIEGLIGAEAIRSEMSR